MKYFYKTNDILETAIDSFFSILNKANDEKYSGELSILLLGSLSRGEATWTYVDDRITLLSDIEFITFYPKGFSDFSAFDCDIKKAAALIEEKMGSSLFHIDNTWIKKEKIGSLERKLLIFDAQEMGVTVIGEDMKGQLPLINITNINLEDIWDIIVHRIFSVLYYGSKLSHTNDCYEYRYLIAKNSLDLMTVLLVKNGRLISGFKNRINEIKKLHISDENVLFFEYCLSVKFGSEASGYFQVDEMIQIFIKLCEDLYNEFKIPLRNKIRNWRVILRRHAGMIKRSLIIKHISYTRVKHLGRLLSTIKENKELDNIDIVNNYILNGYPILQKDK